MIQATGIHHYALSVRDLKATADWYAEIFGFRIEREFGFPDLGIQIIHLVNPANVRIELLHAEGSRPGPDLGTDAFAAINNRGAKHIGLQVDDINKAAEFLTSKGVKFLHEPTRVEMAGVTNLWIVDNEGAQIEIAEPIKK